MNSIADLYTLELEVNGSSSYLGPQDSDISLSDSIHAVYPRAVFSLKDTSGKLLDSRLATLGVNFTFTIGYQNQTIKLPFVVNTFQTTEQDYFQYLNGRLEIELIHSFYTKFETEFKAYEGVPSEIITSLVKDEGFKKLRIESTAKLQSQPYYNPGFSFKEFVEEVLIKNSKSIESSSEPFYCFIDASNNFHYETCSQMRERKSYKTLMYRSGRDKMEEIQKILEFRPFSLKLDSVYPNLKTRLFYIEDSDDLTLQEEEILVTDNGETPLPIFTKSKDFVTKFNNKISSIESLDRQRAKINDEKRQYLLIDRIAVTTLLDVTSCAGKIVTLDVDFEQENISASYSGDYLIEGSTHIWDSKSQKGYTQMILSRQATEFPVESDLIGGLFR